MNKEVLLQNGIDYLEGVARFAGQAEIYEKFLKKFRRTRRFLTFSLFLYTFDAADEED